MSKEILGIVAAELEAAGIPYGYGVFQTDTVPECYFVGRYSETECLTEDGGQEGKFLLTGTAGDAWTLELARAEIARRFPKVGGRRSVTGGRGVVIYYAGSYDVPVGDEGLRRLEINLKTKEWSVN